MAAAAAAAKRQDYYIWCVQTFGTEYTVIFRGAIENIATRQYWHVAY